MNYHSVIIKQIKHGLLALWLVLSCFSTGYAGEPAVKFYTEEYPPYNYWQDGRVNGITTEILRDVLAKLDWDIAISDVQLVPWARAYYEVLNKENTAIYTIARTPEREKLFEWVGPVACAQIGLWARKASNIDITALDELEDYTVGAVREDVGHQLLRTAAPDLKVHLLNSSESTLQMLKEKRIDVFAYDINVVDQLFLKEGLKTDDFELIYVLGKMPFYIGFNPDTNPFFLKEFRTAFSKVATELKLSGCAGE